MLSVELLLARMEHIKQKLHEGGHSLVLKATTSEIFTYDDRGVSDLLQLLDKAPSILAGAEIADKVVGKAAAALMILGKVKAVYTDIISEPALQLFASAAPMIDVTYNNKVEYIINRTKTGWCPMELACKDAQTPEECLQNIQAKLAELSKRQ